MARLVSEGNDSGGADRELGRKATKVSNAKKFKEAMKAGELAIRDGYLDIDTHLVMTLAALDLATRQNMSFMRSFMWG